MCVDSALSALSHAMRGGINMAYRHLVTLLVAILEEVVYPTSADPVGQFVVDVVTIIGLIVVIVSTLKAIF